MKLITLLTIYIFKYNDENFIFLDKIGHCKMKFLAGGNPESAATLLEKAAKILDSSNPEEALSLYSKAAETVGTEDRPKEASEYMAKVAKLQVRH